MCWFYVTTHIIFTMITRRYFRKFSICRKKSQSSCVNESIYWTCINGIFEKTCFSPALVFKFQRKTLIILLAVNSRNIHAIYCPLHNKREGSVLTSFNLTWNNSWWGFLEKYQKRSLRGKILAFVSMANLTGSWIPQMTKSTATVKNTRVSETNLRPYSDPACKQNNTRRHKNTIDNFHLQRPMTFELCYKLNKVEPQ
jgi:hypothetical protein